MRFVVGSAAVTDTSTVPSSLRTIAFPPNRNTVNHHFEFERTGGRWAINGVGWSDVNNRVLANVPRGTIEVWELENTSGGWTHPIHVHVGCLPYLSHLQVSCYKPLKLTCLCTAR